MPKSTKSPSWRDILPVHPAAEIFPLMSPDELRALGEDIKKHGLREPVVLFAEEGGGGIYRETEQLLLDGRNRLDAMEAVGLTTIREGHLYLMDWPDSGYVVKYRLWKSAITGFDPYAFVISANIHRRHLTAEQKRELIAKVLKAQPGKSNRTIAKQTKVDDKTVGKVRRELEGRAEIPHVDAVEDTKGRKQPARKTSTKPPQVSEEVLQQRDTAAERIRRLMGGKTRDDIGEASVAETTRKVARIEELQAEKRRLEIENLGLRSKVEEAKAARKPKLAPDGLATLYCSFCGKSQHDVDTLVTDGGRKPVCICNECVDLAGDIIKKQKMAAAAP
jgi:hypothetical protein